MRFSKNIVALLFFLIIGFSAFSQRLEYGNFLQTDTAIKWSAVYHSILDLTPVNPNFNIQLFYLRKSREGTVTTYEEDSVGFAVFKKTTPKNTLQERLTKLSPKDQLEKNWRFDVALSQNYIYQREAADCDRCFGSNKISFFRVKQLIYYKDHQLFVENVLIQPLIYKKQFYESDNTIDYVGEPVAFKNTNNAQPSSAVFIARTSNLLNFKTFPYNNKSLILSKTNYSLGPFLYKEIKNGFIKAYDTKDDFLPNKNYLKSDSIEFYQNPLVEVPLYDTIGNTIGFKSFPNPFDYWSLHQFELIQDIYFDFKNEKLYSKVIALIPILYTYDSNGKQNGLKYFWGITFDKAATMKVKNGNKKK